MLQILQTQIPGYDFTVCYLFKVTLLRSGQNYLPIKAYCKTGKKSFLDATILTDALRISIQLFIAKNIIITLKNVVYFCNF